MEPKHITEGKVTIDIREYRELVEAMVKYREAWFETVAELNKLKGTHNG